MFMFWHEPMLELLDLHSITALEYFRGLKAARSCTWALDINLYSRRRPRKTANGYQN
jgi:hypothetical protein